MAAHGEITPMPDCAIFADTQSEPRAVYDHLKWLLSPSVLPFPVHVVTSGNLGGDIGSITAKRKFAKRIIPAFVQGTKGEIGPSIRQCTRDYKLVPIERKVRELTGLTKKRAPKTPIVTSWIGISLDEAIRMKPSRDLWRVHRWPLVEMRMSRGDCLEWLKRHDYPQPPRSACVFCPYHSNHEWRQLSEADFADAVVIDHGLRTGHNTGMNGKMYLHRDCKPLDQVDLSTAEDRGQLNLFNNECEGMCGV